MTTAPLQFHVCFQSAARLFGGQRKFIPLLIWLLLVQAHLAGAGELRGLWVDAVGGGFLNAAQVKKLVRDCREYNFNAVFVQMRHRGDAFYLPAGANKEPRAHRVASDFDALAEIIKQCHNGTPRIEVHFWFTSHLIWSSPTPPPQPGHLFNRHQDWLTRDSANSTQMANGFYLDPGHPDANQWLHDVAVDVVKRYEIDGLHWDYLRYPGPDSGYNATGLRRYYEEFGSTGKPAHDDPQFSVWRRRQITDFLRWTTADILQINPRLVVSVAVFANHDDSFGYRFAEWGDWCKEGILDIAIPMNFTADRSSMFISRATRALALKGNRAVYLGLAGYLNSAESSLAQLQGAREMGFPGTVFYSYQSAVAKRPSKPILTPIQPMHNAVVVDNAAAKAQGAWRQGKFGKYHGTDYSFVLDGGNGANRLEFVPRLLREGTYDVYEWHVQGANRATDVPFEIRHATGTNIIRVDQQRDGSQWNFLGRFESVSNSTFSVTVSDSVSNRAQVVIADAVLFHPVTINVPANKQNIEAIQKAEAASRPQTNTNRDTVFAALKKQYQPKWEAVPALQWKTNANKVILKGIVKDADSGKPIYNATVELPKSARRNQKTEPHGVYAFFDTSPGEHEVIVTADGFRSITNRVEVRPGIVTQLDFALR